MQSTNFPNNSETPVGGINTESLTNTETEKPKTSSMQIVVAVVCLLIIIGSVVIIILYSTGALTPGTGTEPTPVPTKTTTIDDAAEDNTNDDANTDNKTLLKATIDLSNYNKGKYTVEYPLEWEFSDDSNPDAKIYSFTKNDNSISIISRTDYSGTCVTETPDNVNPGDEPVLDLSKIDDVDKITTRDNLDIYYYPYQGPQEIIADSMKFVFNICGPQSESGKQLENEYGIYGAISLQIPNSYSEAQKKAMLEEMSAIISTFDRQ